MATLIVIVGLITLISLYDYFTTRSWQQVTSTLRNEAVFEHRNKNYGAYQLRKDYGKNVLFGLVAVVGIAGIGFTALGKSKEVKTVNVDPNGGFITYEIPIEIKKKTPPTEAPTPPKGVVVKTQVFIEPIVSSDPIESSVGPIDPNTLSSTVNSDGTGEAGVGVSGDPSGGVGSSAPEPKVEPIVEDPLFPSTPASFPGGKEALKDFLMDELRMPQIAIELGIKGKCYLQFVVDKEGAISEVSLQRGIPDCNECDKEAMRVIRKMPRWIPAKNEHNKAMRSIFNIPIGFDATH